MKIIDSYWTQFGNYIKVYCECTITFDWPLNDEILITVCPNCGKQSYWCDEHLPDIDLPDIDVMEFKNDGILTDIIR